MKFKIILGIIIPLLIIITLTLLGSLDIGFSVKEDYITRISLQDISSNNQLRRSIKIADIYLENDYFLGKRYDLPRLGICLDDKEGKLQKINAGQLQYSEGEYSATRDPIFGEVQYYYRGSERSIQIDANGKKIVRIFLEPSYEFQYKNYTELLAQYKDYDSLVVYELKNDGPYYNYNECYNLDQEAVEKAIRIPLTP